jgi:hypothetical protein
MCRVCVGALVLVDEAKDMAPFMDDLPHAAPARNEGHPQVFTPETDLANPAGTAAGERINGDDSRRRNSVVRALDKPDARDFGFPFLYRGIDGSGETGLSRGIGIPVIDDSSRPEPYRARPEGI